MSKSNETLNTVLVPAIEQGCSIFLIDQAVAFTFLDSFTMAHDAAMIRNPNKVLIITDIKNELELEEILLHPSLHEIRDVFAILSANESVCLLKIDGQRKWKQICEWIRNETMSMDSSEMFLSNKAHLDNRVIKLATFEVIPFIQLIPRENGRSVLNNKTYFIDGLDGRLVEGFCEAFNCTWELTISMYKRMTLKKLMLLVFYLLAEQEAQYGKLYGNKTADGITGSLLNRQVDVAIGGIAGWYHLHPFFSFTSPMQPISVTCLTPQPRLSFLNIRISMSSN